MMMFLILSLGMTMPAFGKGKATGESPRKRHEKVEMREPVAGLFLRCMSRPGVTSDSNISILFHAARNAAQLFRRTLHDGAEISAKWKQFRQDLGSLILTYDEEYNSAPVGSDGVEVRGIAFNRFLGGIVTSAEQAGIPLEELDFALLRGAAAIESQLSERYFSRQLTDTDKELVQLLLVTTVDQLKRRIFLESPLKSIIRTEAPEEVATMYQARIYDILMPTLEGEAIGIESFLSDPENASDIQAIISMRYNNDAMSDLFAFKYAFEMFFPTLSLSESMIDSIVQRMPGITSDLLREQLEMVQGTSLLSLSAYSSIVPDLPFRYVSVEGLADRVAVLGETPPVPPNVSLFQDAYRDMFQLSYDVLLSDTITSLEWQVVMHDAEVLNPPRPVTLGERFAVKSSQMRRYASLRSHMYGVPEEMARALMILLQSPMNMRI